MQRKYGYIPSLRDKRDYWLKRDEAVELPPAYIKMVQSLGEQRDQGPLGCCSGEGTAGALKLRMNILSYKWPFYPSTLGIYYGARELEGTIESDAGAQISDCFQVMNTYGVMPEDSNSAWSWPFSSDSYRWNKQPPMACYKDALKHKLVKYSRVSQDVDSIKAALVSNLPIVIGVSVYDSFESDAVANTGVVPLPGSDEKLQGGHCMYLWGYGAYNPDYVDGRNSWGGDWGDAGSFHMPFEYLTDPNLCSDLWAVELNQ